MLKNLQLICFEVNNYCNLAEAHKAFCPAIQEFRKGTTPASNDDFISFLKSCVSNGFTGNIGFHYYNEPTLAIDRCIDIGAIVNLMGLETILWSNGTTQINESWFDQVFVTDYPESIQKSCSKSIPFAPDDRMKIYDAQPTNQYETCFRPSNLEMPIDYNGNVHLCCADYLGKVEIGNIITDNFDDIMDGWIDAITAATFGCDVCRRCQSLTKSPAVFDEDYRV